MLAFAEEEMSVMGISTPKHKSQLIKKILWVENKKLEDENKEMKKHECMNWLEIYEVANETVHRMGKQEQKYILIVILLKGYKTK